MRAHAGSGSQVSIQISPQSVPSTPPWFGEVSAFAQVLSHSTSRGGIDTPSREPLLYFNRPEMLHGFQEYQALVSPLQGLSLVSLSIGYTSLTIASQCRILLTALSAQEIHFCTHASRYKTQQFIISSLPSEGSAS
jgi:hypothetical protein